MTKSQWDHALILIAVLLCTLMPALSCVMAESSQTPLVRRHNLVCYAALAGNPTGPLYP